MPDDEIFVSSRIAITIDENELIHIKQYPSSRTETIILTIFEVEQILEIAKTKIKMAQAAQINNLKG